MKRISLVLPGVFLLLIGVHSDQWGFGEESPWKEMTDVPEVYHLDAVFGRTWNDVWAVGKMDTFLHWSGAQWKEVRRPESAKRIMIGCILKTERCLGRMTDGSSDSTVFT